MSWLSSLASRLDDALNPIVVKELRQAARGRFLAGVLLFFLALQLLTLGIYLLTQGISTIELAGGQSHGEEVFGILAGILFFAAVFCVPVYAAVRIYSESAGDQMALFFVSTLAPHRIVAGKLASNLALSLLLFAACLPYLSFTYYLRGIDLPSVLVALTIGLLASASAIQGAIFIASLPVSRVFRILIGLGGLGALMMLYVMSLTFALMLPDAGVGSRLDSWQFWGPALGVLTSVGLSCGLVFFLTVALITHAAANRAFPVRLYAMTAWLLSGVVVGYLCFEHGEREAAESWLALAFSGFAAALLPAVCARDRMSLRVRDQVPRSLAARPAAFLLFSGSANGVAWSVAMIALTAAAGAVFDRQLGGPLEEPRRQLLGFCGYVLAYALLAAVLQRHWLRRRLRPNQTWVLALVLMAALSLGPLVIGFLVAPDAVSRSLDVGLWTVLTPFAPFQDPVSELASRFGLGWALVMAIIAGRWLLAQAWDFRPPGTARDESEAEGTGPSPEGQSG